MAFAEWVATMSRPVDGGFTQRAHLEMEARRGSTKAQRLLTPPAFPQPLAYVWEWWQELHASRPEGFHGLAALTYPVLSAWAQMTGREVEPFETDLLLRLDAAFRRTLEASA